MEWNGMEWNGIEWNGIEWNRIYIFIYINITLATARMQVAAGEIVLWTTPSEPPKALQASECSELLDPMRASCLILAQHQPGKFGKAGSGG